ncbi:MAG: tRNA (N6-threonylcarbamoyladenosine(37)-N6)-methyltransferase TrmO [Deltaproteobacteria bacterium]|nr:tRNA (N6-threonylcarbamoyladenosine(37)-N6)-methyltransferase TrmO [Deltaproteobacteria bacterium]
MKNNIEIILKSVGIVKSEIKEPPARSEKTKISLSEKIEKIKAERKKVKETIAEIIIEPDKTDLLDGIEDHSHVMILYWGDKVSDKAREIKKVHPMGIEDLPEKGIFATCSQARPNPILITTVKLIGKKDNILKVQGLEAFDNSPIVDIKPYSTSYHQAKNPKTPEWMQKIHKKLKETAHN